MADKGLLLIAGLGALYFLTRPGSAFAYPPSSPIQPKPPSSGGGSGSGSGSGFSFGGGTVTPNSSGSGYTYAPTSGGPVVNCPGDPSCPGGGPDSGDACDTTSDAYDPQLCNVENGTDSFNICDPASYFYDASQCTGSDTASTYPVDTGDPCDPSSYAYDATVCSGVPDYSGGGGVPDWGYPDYFSE